MINNFNRNWYIRFISLFLTVSLCLYHTPAFAQPNITGIDKTAISHKDSITISGSSFGMKEPVAPLIWDTFESGAISNKWSGFNGIYAITATDNRHSHSSLSLESECQDGDEHHLMGKASDGTAGKWYAQYYFKFASNFKFGTGTYGNPNSALANVKFFRMWPKAGGSYPNYVLAWHGFANSTMSVVEGTSGGTGYFGMNPHTAVPIGTWNSQEFEYEENSAVNQPDGGIRYWLNCHLWLDDRKLLTSTTDRPTREKYPFMIGFLASWGSPSEPTKIWLDDVYVDRTWARVMIGDAATWDACTHREIQIPTAWSETSITVTVNQGSFSNGQTVYLYVVDENGNVNEQGYTVTFGAGQTLQGDVNQDGKVDIKDLILVAKDFGKTTGFNPGCDLNGDARVDIKDLIIVAKNFGRSL